MSSHLGTLIQLPGSLVSQTDFNLKKLRKEKKNLTSLTQKVFVEVHYNVQNHLFIAEPAYFYL